VYDKLESRLYLKESKETVRIFVPIFTATKRREEYQYGEYHK